MKRVSFKVANAIKEAGYNVPCDMYYHIYDDEYESETSLEMTGTGSNDFINSLNRYRCAAPTYFEVWLWLWREKGIYIEILHYYSSLEVCVWDKEYKLIKRIERQNANADPEEAIITAIEHLVDNDLIK